MISEADRLREINVELLRDTAKVELRLRTVEAERDAYAQELENRQHSAEARVEAAEQAVDAIIDLAQTFIPAGDRAKFLSRVVALAESGQG